MQKADNKKTLMLGKIVGRRRKGWQRMRWLNSITDSHGHEFEQAPGRTGKPGMLQSMGSQRVRHDRATEWQNCLTEQFYEQYDLFKTITSWKTVKFYIFQGTTESLFILQAPVLPHSPCHQHPPMTEKFKEITFRFKSPIWDRPFCGLKSIDLVILASGMLKVC